jgi:hypothetical protein
MAQEELRVRETMVVTGDFVAPLERGHRGLPVAGAVPHHPEAAVYRDGDTASQQDQNASTSSHGKAPLSSGVGVILGG